MSSEWFKMDNLFVYPTLFFLLLNWERNVSVLIWYSAVSFFNPVH